VNMEENREYPKELNGSTEYSWYSTPPLQWWRSMSEEVHFQAVQYIVGSL
jgi:hypothetical protein